MYLVLKINDSFAETKNLQSFFLLLLFFSMDFLDINASSEESLTLKFAYLAEKKLTL